MNPKTPPPSGSRRSSRLSGSSGGSPQTPISPSTRTKGKRKASPEPESKKRQKVGEASDAPGPSSAATVEDAVEGTASAPRFTPELEKHEAARGDQERKRLSRTIKKRAEADAHPLRVQFSGIHGTPGSELLALLQENMENGVQLESRGADTSGSGVIIFSRMEDMRTTIDKYNGQQVLGGVLALGVLPSTYACLEWHPIGYPTPAQIREANAPAAITAIVRVERLPRSWKLEHIVRVFAPASEGHKIITLAACVRTIGGASDWILIFDSKENAARCVVRFRGHLLVSVNFSGAAVLNVSDGGVISLA